MTARDLERDAEEREDEIARLRATGEKSDMRSIHTAPSAAHYAAAMREKMERDALARSAELYGRDFAVQSAEREREIRRLRR